MKIGIPHTTRPAASALVFCVGIATLATAAPMVRPDARSPLATDGRLVYAVAEDKRTLIVADPAKSTWTAITTVEGADIRGLAWAENRLYFTNLADGSVRAISTIGGDRKSAVVHQGPPLVRPTELTISVGFGLVIADPGSAALYRLPLTERRGSTPAASGPTPIRAEVRITDSTYIAGWPGGEVVLSDPETGFLGQITNIRDESAKYRPLQERTGDTPVQWNQKGSRPETLRRRGYPGLSAPGPLTAFNGIVYAIDSRTGNLFAAGVYDARAIRLPAPEPEVRFGRVIVNSVWLIGLDARTGRLVRWPRPVPSELTLLPGARPQSLFPVIEYLHRRKLLLTRRLEITESVDVTLERARMVWPARGAPAEPQTREGHYASFCLLNPTLCVKGLPRPDIASGTPIVLAELYAERYTAATQVELNGTETLGQVVDAAITSDEFKLQKTEEHLRRINGVDDKDPPTLRDATSGSYRISQELVRYVIPIEAAELQEKGDFARLQEQVRKTIRIAPLERILLSAATMASRVPLTESDSCEALQPDDECAKVRLANATLLQAIQYVGAAATRTVFVGIAEEDLDATHSDFADPNGVTVLYTIGDESDLVPFPKPAAAWRTPGVEPVKWRGFETRDHATAVTAIIAGRGRPYQEGEGLTRSFAGLFAHTADATALAGDIERALNVSPMTVVNLSLKALDRREAPKLRTVIEDKRKSALFVVAAPAGQGQFMLCEGNNVWYPACHGIVPANVNVLVVGGTNLDGTAIHPRSPIGKAVNIYAPAVGYFSAGKHNSYVPVEGTSFATALVSAAAAMLSSAGVKEPAMIRNRLIATASLMDVPGRPLWARRLNVKRALSHFQHAVLVDAGTKQEQLAQLLNPERTIEFRTRQGNQLLPVPVGRIRRLKRVEGDPSNFELVFEMPAGDDPPQLRLELVRAPAAQWETCFFPVGTDGQVNGPRTCTDLSALFDYVGPIE